MKGLLRLFLKLAPLLGLRLGAMALIFMQTVALARVFGAEVFGFFSFAQTTVVMAALVATFGFDKLLMRRLASVSLPLIATDPGWGPVLRFCLRLSAALALGLSALGLVLFWGAGLGGIYTLPLIGAACALPLLVTRQFAEGLSLGAKRVKRSIIGSQIVFPAAMILGAAAVAMSGAARDGGAITAVYVAAMTISAAAALLVLRPIAPQLRRPGDRPAGPGDVAPARATLASGASFGLVAAGFVIGPHMDVLLLGLLAGPADVAMVRVGARVAEAVGLVRAVVMLQYAPLLAEAHGRGDDARLRRLVRELGLIFLATGVPLLIVALTFAPQAMALFGPEFVAGVPVMRIYVIGVFFTMLAGPGSTLLTMCGHEGLSARILWVALGVNLGLDLALIPIYGALGCAMANMVSLLVLGLGAATMSARRLGIQPALLLALVSSRRAQ